MYEVQKHKISFCTVCMGRLNHLKHTLPQNIRDALPYGNIEFVVLNYNSKDNLDEWFESNMLEFCKNGILKYYKTIEPIYFNMSHSKNVAAKKASGDIICNIDADNYIGKGFAEFVNEIFTKNSATYITVEKNISPSDCYGRICVLKNDFYQLRGYDENMKKYGGEDSDFCQRLNLLKRKPYFIRNSLFLKAINHDNMTRLENGIDKIQKAYFRFISPAMTEFIFLFKNSTFLRTKLALNHCLHSESIENVFYHETSKKGMYSLFKNEWEENRFVKLGTSIKLRSKHSNQEPLVLTQKGDLISRRKAGSEFQRIFDIEEIADMLLLLRLLKNHEISIINKEKKKITVNDDHFGETKFTPTFFDRLILTK